MNCKPGDLAVIVFSGRGFLGKLVRCVRLHDSNTRDLDGARTENNGPRWVLESPMQSHIDEKFYYTYADKFMRPLRDNDGTDEMLRIAGLPHKEHA